MLTVKGASPDYTPHWSEKLVLEFLQKFLHKEHWEQIDKSVFNFENDTPFWQHDEARRIVKKAMDHCNKALDVYGTAQCLLDDLKVYFNFWMYTEIDYKDSHLVQYVPKSRIMQYIVRDFYKNSGLVSRNKIMDLYVLKMTTRLERQMAGSYELISRRWLDVAIRDLTDIFDVTIMPGMTLIHQSEQQASLWHKNPPVLRDVVAHLAQFFDDKTDPHLLSCLENILRQYAKVPSHKKVPACFQTCHDLCEQERCLKEISSWLIYVLNKNPYTFLSFVESEKLLGAEFPIEPPVIRLICHNDEKFLFVKEVYTAIRRVLKSKEKKQVIPKDLLNLESEKDRKKGIYHTIPHSEYLKILEMLEFNVESITLVNENIVRTRHRTVPIISPYNTQCIPVVEVFDELLSILTIGMQFWRKIQPKNMGKVQKKFEEVCQMFMNPAKSRYFMEMGRVEQLGEILRKSVAPLLEKQVIVEAPNLYAYDSEYFFITFLRGGMNQLKLPDLYNDIYPLAMIVSSFRSVYFEKQPVRLIELLMAIQDCLAICMIRRMSMVQEFICKQKYCLRYWFAACNCKAAEAIKTHPQGDQIPQIDMIQQDEIEMEFENYEVVKMCFNNLLVKSKDRQFKLVNSEAVYAYVKCCLGMRMEKNLRDRVLEIYKNKFSFGLPARKSCSFLMTSEEAESVTANVLMMFEGRRRSGGTSIDLMNTRPCIKNPELDSLTLTELTADAYNDCLKYLSGLLKNSVEFEKCYPDRTAYIPFEELTTQLGVTQKTIKSGEFLGLVKARMQRNPSAHLKSYWDYLSRTIFDFHNLDTWQPALLTDIVRFGITPIGLDKFCFIPNLQCTLRDLPRKVSTMIVATYPKKTEVLAEDGGTEKDQLERVRKELAGANEHLKKKDAVILLCNEKVIAQASNIQQLQLKVNELSGANLANTSLIHVYAEEMEAKTAECEELKKKLAASEQETRLARQKSDTKLEEFKKKLADMDKSVMRIERLNEALRLEEAENKAEQQECKRILQQHTERKAQMDNIQKENQKLQDAVKSEKQKLTMKEEQWKKESDKTIAVKNAEIQKLKQQVSERENQVKNLENNHKTVTRSIRADLSTCREEKAALERQLAQATTKILNLEAPRVTQVDMDAQLATAIQENEQLIGENQYWQSQHRMETINRETCQQQNGRLQEHIQWLESQMRTRGSSSTSLTPPAPNASSLLPQRPRSPTGSAPPSVQRNPPQSGSSSTRSPGPSQPSRASQLGQSVMPVVSGPGSAPLLPEVPTVNTEGPFQPAASPNPAPTPPPAPIPAPSAPECSICLNDLTRNSRKTECGRCKKQFHKSCINQWTATNATCPMCRSSFPNPQDFPPLGRS